MNLNSITRPTAPAVPTIIIVKEEEIKYAKEDQAMVSVCSFLLALFLSPLVSLSSLLIIRFIYLYNNDQ
jgi:hypothetical protein